MNDLMPYTCHCSIRFRTCVPMIIKLEIKEKKHDEYLVNFVLNRVEIKKEPTNVQFNRVYILKNDLKAKSGHFRRIKACSLYARVRQISQPIKKTVTLPRCR